MTDRPTIFTDRCVYVFVGGGAQMSVPMPRWLWQLTWTRPEQDRGTQCDDRLLAAGVLESYLYLVQECTKEEAWRRIKLMRAALAEAPDGAWRGRRIHEPAAYSPAADAFWRL